MESILNSPVRYLKGVGPKRAKSFAESGIITLEDLLYYFPRRYEDRTSLIPIAKLVEGNTYTVKGRILGCVERRSFRRGLSILEAVVNDSSGNIFCVWFNQHYLKQYFKPGQELILYGKVERYGKRLQINSPEFELVDPEHDASLSIGRIVPVYSLPEGMTQRYFRYFVKNVLDSYLSKLNDFLPFDIRSRAGLLNLAKSLLEIHFPENDDWRKQAYQRLAFEEFFIFQLPLALRKLKNKEKPGIRHNISGNLIGEFISGLPFQLTDSQAKVLEEIKKDMAGGFAMQRLLQGDVGSGKTVVATAAAIIALQGGYQAVIMVPTEILARQHYEKILGQVAGLKTKNAKIRIALLTGSIKKNKEKLLREIKSGRVDLIIGTHALLQEEVEFKKLGLVVIDEQHKFGVGQRSLLPQKGDNPDILIMTATPIPRTLAITLYGDLEISVISHMPAGRGAVKTLTFSHNKAEEAYEILRHQLQNKRQAFIVYPVIEESYALDIAGAKKMYEELKKGELRDFRLGLIHGKLKPTEQQDLMARFKKRELDALVSTTVLEVGIDIPNATCMLIAHAERFGLSQLHQLRGRVGRGGYESFCLLVTSSATQNSDARLRAMVKYQDGFRIAEEDLKIRGPGEFFGLRQHGLTELRIANPLVQMQLLKKAREEAIRLVNSDPKLEARQNILLKEKLLERFPEHEKLMVVG